MRHLLIALLLTLAQPAQADPLRERIIEVLRTDGFETVRINRTWLGRVRFVGERDGAEREIVVNPATGVILRDYLQIFDDEDEGDSESSINAEPDEETEVGEDGPESGDDDDGDDENDDDADDDDDSESDDGDDDGDDDDD